MATISSPGIGSGLDISGIVQKLMSVEQQPLVQLQQNEATDQAKISAYGSLKSSLATLQSALEGLASTAKFNNVSATVGDATVLTANATNSAVPGNYQVEVSKLAQAHKVASAAFANTTDAVGTGTLSFDFGTYDSGAGKFTSNGSGAKTIAIAAGQNTLSGIRDAVNVANIGVTATIVNDGNSPGNHLVFTSSSTGAANSLKITAVDDDGNNVDAAGLSQLAFDPAGAAGAGRNMDEKSAAQDAQFKVDSISMHKSSNTISDAIEGITLTLTKTNVNLPTTLTVATSTTSANAGIGAFVKAYNDLDATFDKLTKYDVANKQASVLTGDSTVRVVQSQLRSMLGGRLGTGAYTTLSQVGVSFQLDGTMALDPAKLNSALATNGAGVMQLFAAMGSATDSLVSVTGYTQKTTPGTYALDVSQLATRGALTGDGPAALTITDGVNDALSVSVDGVSTSVKIAAGVYASADALAAEVQSKINGASALTAAGASVAVTQAGGVLTVTSNRYGATSAVAVSGTAATDLFGASPAIADGVNATGTLGGQTLLGSGQTLQGATGSALEGLQFQVTGGATGARGTVTYQTGFAYQLNELVKSIIGSDGIVAARTDGLQKDISDLQKRQDQLNAHLADVEANYTKQFNALDLLLAQLSAQSAALTQQLAALPNITQNQ